MDQTEPARPGDTMEILGIGTDIVECLRVGRMIEAHGEAFLRRVYTVPEIRHCQARKHAIEHFAARWAAKEAVMKAIGGGWTHGVSWTDIEIRVAAGGTVRVYVRGGAKDAALLRNIHDVHASLAHCRTYATAYALAVSGEGGTGAFSEALFDD